MKYDPGIDHHIHAIPKGWMDDVVATLQQHGYVEISMYTWWYRNLGNIYGQDHCDYMSGYLRGKLNLRYDGVVDSAPELMKAGFADGRGELDIEHSW